MRKGLGKKSRVQNGTLVAFSCDCTSSCRTATCINCTEQKASATVNQTNYARGLSTAQSGRWAI